MSNLLELKGTLLKNEPLAKYTSWRVGGPAKQMYFPYDKADLIRFIQTLPQEEPIYWIGLGSNLLISDNGIDGTVICTRNRLKQMKCLDQETIYVEAGVPCSHFAKFSSDQNLTNGEFLAGIPGTLGGALKMNAGAYGYETWSFVESVETINKLGYVQNRNKQAFQIGYRNVKGFENEWFLSALIKLSKGNQETGHKKIKTLLEKRNSTQPTNKPTCGSVFKNPTGDFAARLIEACGLKGYQVGEAIVSDKHANFIINLGNATAVDIEQLISHIQFRVNAEYGILLQTEVCRIGYEQ